MIPYGKRAAVAVLGALAAGSFTVVLAADPVAGAPSASAMEAMAAGCTVATADRAATPVSECASCHGSLGSSGGRNMFQMPGHEFGHPVDIELDGARAANPGAYASREQLPGYLPLADGKITCLTCHDGRTGNRHSLAKPSQKEMCLACHRM